MRRARCGAGARARWAAAPGGEPMRPRTRQHGTVPAGLMADAALVRGIAAYRRHPYRRDLPDPPVIWQEGGSRLLDYGSPARARRVLVVPSLVNRAYVLDLAPERSMLRWLGGRRGAPVLLDWGWPGRRSAASRSPTTCAGRLDRALDALPGRDGAGRLLHGRAARAGGGAAPGGPVRGPAAARHAVGFPRPGAAASCCRRARRLGAGGRHAAGGRAAGDVPDAGRGGGSWRSTARSGARPRRRARPHVRGDRGLAGGRHPARRSRGRGVPGRLVWREHAGERGVAGGRHGGRSRRRCACRRWWRCPAQDRIVPPESAAPLGRETDPGRRRAAQPKAAGHVGMVAGVRGRAELWLWPALDWMRAL